MARRRSLLDSVRWTLARTLAPELRVRRFDAASGGRRWDHRPHFGNANAESLAGGPAILPRARHAVANNAWAANAIGVYETALVGAGIESKSAHPDASTRAIIASAFKAWTAHADADGVTDWFGLQAAIVRALVGDGEAFVHVLNTAEGPRLRVLPREMIDESRTTPMTSGAADIAGIRFDASGQRIGYWVFRERPQDTLNGLTESVLIPASDILHIFKPIGAGAVRGVSWLAPVLLTLNELDQWSDAQLVNAKVQAMLCGFVLDKDGKGQSFEGEDPESLSLEPGTLKRLPGGFDVRFTSPQQAQSAMEHGVFMLRAVAAGMGIPEFLLSGDMRGANYSSMRSAMVAFRQRVEQIQFHTLMPQLLRPVWERVVTWLILSGKIEARDFEANRDTWLSVDHYPPAMPWVDPAKDAKAQREMVDGGFMSRRQVVASLGFDVEQVDAERAADAQRERELGLQSQPQNPANANDDEDEEEEPDSNAA